MATIISSFLASLLATIVPGRELLAVIILRLNIIPLGFFKISLNILLLKVTLSIAISPVPSSLLVLNWVLTSWLLNYWLLLLPLLLELLLTFKTSLFPLWLLELVAAIKIPLFPVSLFLLLHFPIPVRRFPLLLKTPSLLNARLVIPVPVFRLPLHIIELPVFKTPVPCHTIAFSPVKSFYTGWSKPAFISTLYVRTVKPYFIIPEFSPTRPIGLTNNSRPDPFMRKSLNVYSTGTANEYAVIPMVII
jgi:hypothetical protein